MEDVLARMKEDKRIRFINSAMKEFGANSFEKASTNVIVKEAGISKGLLYHYFDSKESLFEYLLVFAVKSMGVAIVDQVEWDKGDLIDRMYKIIEIKMEIVGQYPYMLDFGKIMYENRSIEDMKKIIDAHLPDLYSKVYSHNIDFTLFKEHLDVTRVIKMIQFFLDGYAEQMVHKFKTVISSVQELDEEVRELKKYLDMYKEAFYKK